MYSGYFNYVKLEAVTAKERRQFRQRWWRLGAWDRQWAPPYYAALARLLDPTRQPHLARLQPRFLHLEALPGRPRSLSRTGAAPTDGSPMFEVPVSTALALRHPQAAQGVAFLSLWHMVNDEESVERLLDYVLAELSPSGVRQLAGPVHPSLCLPFGVLASDWNLTPPLHTPYYPPFTADLLSNILTPVAASRLYTLAVAANEKPLDTNVHLRPFDPQRLAGDLLPLLAQMNQGDPLLPAPDGLAAAYLWQWLAWSPWQSWLAEVAGKPAGFVVIQPDLAGRLRRARGGRPWWGRLWLHWTSRKPVRGGRIVLGGVLPAFQRQGIGRQLLAQAVQAAQAHGWQTLTIGPLPEEAPAARLLQAAGATPQQVYQSYTYAPRPSELW